MTSGIRLQILRASTHKLLCVRKLFIGKIYCTLNIQGICLYRVIISNDVEHLLKSIDFSSFDPLGSGKILRLWF